MSEKTKVHKVTLLIVDHDDLGAQEVASVLENSRYPNHCICPQTMLVQTAEVDWDDDHPLNRRATRREAFDKLFEGM